MIRLLFIKLLKYFPWVILITFLSWVYITGNLPFLQADKNRDIEERHETLLTQIEALGKIELVKYHFKEVTELQGISKWKQFFRNFNPDMKAVLISSGEAVGCIDLTLLNEGDLNYRGDTLVINLPDPEICYYKIDLNKSRIYDLETGYLASDDEERKFVERAYKSAELQIRKSAYEGGISDQTKQNASIILLPLMNKIHGGPVQLNFKLAEQQLKIK